MSDLGNVDRVLIVDDSPDALRFLTAAMEELGVEVLVANSGDAALSILERTRPDLILMDAMMPGLDGFEATQRIKQDPRNDQIPIIFMTGLTESEHAIRALRAGGTDYVRKPLNIDELFARVGVHLANARSARESSTALKMLHQPVLTVSTGGEVLWSTAEAKEILAALPDGESGADGLPEFLRTPVSRLFEPGVPPGQTQRVEIEGGAVEITLVDHSGEDQIMIKLTDLREEALVALLQDRHALTHREAEVLLWVSYGKPNRVISEILGISPRTVNKHLEQVFAKLGVETRSAAAATAVRTISH